MRPILVTTEAQRARSDDPSAPPTALASPACGWSRVNKDNLRVIVSETLCRSMLRSFLGLRVLMSLLALTATLRAQTNAFPSSGNAGIGTTSPNAALEIDSSLGAVRAYGLLRLGSGLDYSAQTNQRHAFRCARGCEYGRTWSLWRTFQDRCKRQRRYRYPKPNS